MKVLYMAYRHAPTDLDAGSSLDHTFCEALRDHGLEIEIAGPISGPEIAAERLFRRLYARSSGKRSWKFPVSKAWRASRVLDRAVASSRPDAVFTLFPAPLVFWRRAIPCVFALDTTFLGQEEDWPLYGPLALRLSVWEERRAFARSTRLLTYSAWARRDLIENYGIESERIAVTPMPSSLPTSSVPTAIDPWRDKRLTSPLRLLLVGRVRKRKGIDTAIETVREINAAGTPAELTICGLDGSDSDFVKYAGLYRKSDPVELAAYTELYRRAHLLLHPAIFEAAGIVPSEAAAFGTPTITNATGALATTVAHGVSGLVLPKGSPPSAYRAAILELIRSPEAYYELCRSTRRRYEQELNWEVTGTRTVALIKDAVAAFGAIGGRK
ncbi:MAG TPA: glycosyltransferase family 4 protein [Thermoanaerobaculia bacterium]|nr:glycosyltransferase family 4 protein [Thermoanaerobaculia bacterium]